MRRFESLLQVLINPMPLKWIRCITESMITDHRCQFWCKQVWHHRCCNLGHFMTPIILSFNSVCVQSCESKISGMKCWWEIIYKWFHSCSFLYLWKKNEIMWGVLQPNYLKKTAILYAANSNKDILLRPNYCVHSLRFRLCSAGYAIRLSDMVQLFVVVYHV